MLTVLIPTTHHRSQTKKLYVKVSADPGSHLWLMLNDTYVFRAKTDVEMESTLIDQSLPTKYTTPLSNGYGLEMDQSLELDGGSTAYFQRLIGVLRWKCELGCIDVIVVISLRSLYLANPQECHLRQVLYL
jgi:hypothetical protein